MPLKRFNEDTWGLYVWVITASYNEKQQEISLHLVPFYIVMIQ